MKTAVQKQDKAATALCPVPCLLLVVSSYCSNSLHQFDTDYCSMCWWLGTPATGAPVLPKLLPLHRPCLFELLLAPRSSRSRHLGDLSQRSRRLLAVSPGLWTMFSCLRHSAITISTNNLVNGLKINYTPHMHLYIYIYIHR